jgi:putative SOS response-associated peptidase YedK
LPIPRFLAANEKSLRIEHWLGVEPDPSDLLAPFPAELMAMWPVSTRVKSPDNDDSSLLDPAA